MSNPICTELEQILTALTNHADLNEELTNQWAAQVLAFVQPEIEIELAVSLGGIALDLSNLIEDPDSKSGLIKSIEKTIDHCKNITFIASPTASAHSINSEKTQLPIIELDFSQMTDLSIYEEFSLEVNGYLENVDAEILDLGHNPTPDQINHIYRIFHTIKGLAGYLNLDPLTQTAHRTEKLLGLLREAPDLIHQEILLALMDVTQIIREHLLSLRESIESKTIWKTQTELNHKIDLMEKWCKETEQKSKCDVLSPKKIEVENDNSGTQIKKAKAKEYLQVGLSKVDEMVNSLGELVILESMIANIPNQSSEVTHLHRQLSKTVRQLHQLGLQMRLVPIRPIFHKLSRIAMDAAQKLGKSIQISMFGDETEIDKVMADKISEPLLHMIRNAVDHGIENSQDRLLSSKLEQGNIILRAQQEGNKVWIEMSDDGKGLDAQKLIAKAKKLGLISEDDSLKEEDAFHLIFKPGFSTAAQVTEISGRGMGMDIVKQQVESLRGQVHIHSELGQGTTFLIELPLSLASLEGLLVKIGSTQYIVPGTEIIETVITNDQKFIYKGGQIETYLYKDHNIPYFDLRAYMNEVNLSLPRVLLIMQIQKKIYALAIDGILGRQHFVMKPLGNGLDSLKTYSGGAILPNGQIGLILDCLEIIKTKNTVNHSHPSVSSITL